MTPAMHITLLTQHYWPHDVGGSGISVRALAEGLVERNHRVTVLAQAQGKVAQTASRRGVDIRYLPYANRFNAWPTANGAVAPGFAVRAARQLLPEVSPTLPRDLGRELRRLGPDILHTHVLSGVSTRAWGAAAAQGIPVAHTLRDYYMLCLRGTQVRAGKRCEGRCATCVAGTRRRRGHSQNVDAVVAISEFVLDRHLAAGYFAGAPVKRVIANGFDVDAAGASAAAPRPTAPPSPSAPLRVGYLGRLHESKGIEEFIDAFRRLRGDARAVGLVAGSGEASYTEQLGAQSSGLPVSFLGNTDATAFLRAIDVLVVPSRFEEPFGRVVIEAFAEGVPVVCARRGGAAELVNDDRNGWLYEPDEPGALLARLRCLLERGVPSGMAQHARQRAADFDIARTIAAHEALYDDLLQRRGEATERAAKVALTPPRAPSGARSPATSAR